MTEGQQNTKHFSESAEKYKAENRRKHEPQCQLDPGHLCECLPVAHNEGGFCNVALRQREIEHLALDYSRDFMRSGRVNEPGAMPAMFFTLAEEFYAELDKRRSG